MSKDHPLPEIDKDDLDTIKIVKNLSLPQKQSILRKIRSLEDPSGQIAIHASSIMDNFSNTEQ